MAKRTQAELKAIAALEQFAATSPVTVKPVQRKAAPPEIVQEEPSVTKKAPKGKAAKDPVEPVETKAKAKPRNIVLQKFSELGWMAKGMIILIILGIFAEIVNKL